MTVDVISALYGDADSLREPAHQSPLPVDRWILISDRPRKSEAWEVITKPTNWTQRVAARHPKCLSHLYSDAEVVVWVDAQFEIVGSEFVGDLVGLLDNADVAMFRHPWLSWVDEVEATVRDRRYSDPQQFRRQMAQFEDPGAHWASCVMARRMSPAVIAFEREWWTEVRCHSGKDQIALSPLLVRHGLKVAPINGTYRQHSGLILHDHHWGPWRKRWEDLKAQVGWRCALCHAANRPKTEHCVNSWLIDGLRRGCNGTREER